jgi:hypothetical protein
LAQRTGTSAKAKIMNNEAGDKLGLGIGRASHADRLKSAC